MNGRIIQYYLPYLPKAIPVSMSLRLSSMCTETPPGLGSIESDRTGKLLNRYTQTVIATGIDLPLVLLIEL